MNIITKIKTKNYSLRTVLRTGGVAVAVGIILGSYVTAVGLPAIKPVLATVAEAFNPSITYTAPEKVVEPATPEKVEVYFEEEMAKLSAKYEQAHKDEARNNAIERVKEEFEIEQEQIRERALFQ